MPAKKNTKAPENGLIALPVGLHEVRAYRRAGQADDQAAHGALGTPGLDRAAQVAAAGAAVRAARPAPKPTSS
jgi:hypothetical protein